MLRRRCADLLLFCVTLTELVILFRLTPTFGVADWIYILQHLTVLGVALARPRPSVRDYSMPTSIAVAISYAYPYAQVIYLRWSPGEEAWPAGGLALVTLAAGLSFLSLLIIRRRFGVRPALRGLVTSGPYRLVRYQMYLSYVLGCTGATLEEWIFMSALLVVIGWAFLVYPIHAEERVISQDAGWGDYLSHVRYRLF